MDQLDHAIIECLLADGRATYAKVGGVVGLSVAATKRRIDRLVREHVIRGFTAVVDPQVLGWNLEAHVELFTTGTVPFPTMRRDLEALPEVAEAFTVAGKADAVLRVVAGDMMHLERVISRVRGLGYVQQTDTTLLLSRLLHRPMADPTASSPANSWSETRNVQRGAG
ncbi:MAG: Lrp/AsnC family transcriptional regulator [Nocardioidaceae bacterium]|nr:Lrp/AsnC family transcriptional regulator [Nocardioidaceae bacterium]